MNKKLFILLTSLTIICILILAVGCDRSQNNELPSDEDAGIISGDTENSIGSGEIIQEHIHTYAEEWSSDNQYHWHSSTCDHVLTADTSQHSFDSNGMCSVCKYYTTYGFTFQLNSDNYSYSITGLEDGNEVTQLIIPSSYSGKPVTAIAQNAFKDCDLKSITVDDQNAIFKSDGNCLIEKETNRLALGCKNSVIPSYVTKIGSAAFEGCKGLTSIEIPSNVEYIGYDAFRNCADLTTVRIQSGITNIYDGAFQNCSNLKDIDLPQGLTDIGFQAFYGCKSLTTINIPAGTQSIGAGAFAFCSNLTSVTIPVGVDSIGALAFVSCNLLTIYCADIDKPDNWDNTWNSGSAVEWGYDCSLISAQ